MKRKHFMIISAVLALFFGTGSLIMPEKAFAPMGLTVDPLGGIFVRGMGTIMIGFTIAMWMSRNEKPSASLKSILIMWMIFHLGGLIINTHAIATHLLPLAAAGPTIIHILFGGGSVYYLLRMKNE